MVKKNIQWLYVLIFLIGCSNLNGWAETTNSKLLGIDKMVLLRGGSTCDDECPTTGANVCKGCFCFSSQECSTYKEFDTCAEADDGPGCTNTN